MFLLEVFIIIAASRAACMASADPWSSWSTCTKTCGGGYRTRHQLCHYVNGTIHLCYTQRETCEAQHCPLTVTVHWSAHWSEWSRCSVTCGTGESVRHWLCPAQTPLIGKRSTCTEHSERQTCSAGLCPIVSPWSNWNACTKTCEGGHRTREKMCHYLNGPSFVCDTQTQTCETQHCPITVPAHWSEWSKCSATCGTGESVRHWICATLSALIGKRSACTEHLERQTCSSGSCPIGGHWGSWSEWSKCPLTCGEHSQQNRHRVCNNPAPSNGGQPCAGSPTESQHCLSSACHVDGHWGIWSEWSKCPITCGGHSQNRHRSCNNPAPSNGGRPCVGSNMESHNCSLSACPVDGHWGIWSEWSKCPVTCGGNSQNRHRACNNPVPINGGRSCVGTNIESQNCSLSACPVDGHWGIWSEWSKCPVTCGGHLQNRHRSCNNPVPSIGGRSCVGSDMESQNCSLSACPVDGHWVIWSEWSKCPVTCGGNSQNRHRACNNPVPSNGGRPCVGSNMESLNCSLSACPVDGHWSSWSEWSKCPVTCGGNSQNRHRACNNPVPSNGGRPCVGSNMESENCSLSACPVDGHWGIWSEWSKCPVTCGGHSQNRHRACNNPVPNNGGRPCVGSNMETQNCSLSACPVDGQWGIWSEWSKCPVTCGGHSQDRHRACINPAPSNGGRPCVGSNIESQNCSLSACPVDGHWGSWSEWSKCPVTCGGHSQNRHRSCNNPTPSNGGRSCEGSHMESQNCSLFACPVDGKWSGWSEFSKCSVSCGLGTQIRSRSCSNPARSNGGLDCLGLSIEAAICSFPACVPEPRVCDKVRLLSSISHNNSFSKNGNSSCTDPGYQPSRVLIQELCNAPSTSLHISSQVIDVCNQALAFSPVVRKDDITGSTDYGILIECHGNQLKVASQDCTNNVYILDLNGTESDKYYVVDW